MSRSKTIGAGLLAGLVAALLLTLCLLCHYEWRPDQPGEHKLAVRATDGENNVQTAEQRGTVPQGATGYHKVTARVLA